MDRNRRFVHRPAISGRRLPGVLVLLVGLLTHSWHPGFAQQTPHRIALPLIQTRPAAVVTDQWQSCQINYQWIGEHYGYAKIHNLTTQPIYDVTVEMTFYTTTVALGRVVTGTVPLYGVLPHDKAMVMLFSGLPCSIPSTTHVATKVLDWNAERDDQHILAPLAIAVTDARYTWHLYDVDVEVTNTVPVLAKEWRISMRDGYGVRTYAYTQTLAPGQRRTITLSSSHSAPPGLEAQGLAAQP